MNRELNFMNDVVILGRHLLFQMIDGPFPCIKIIVRTHRLFDSQLTIHDLRHLDMSRDAEHVKEFSRLAVYA